MIVRKARKSDVGRLCELCGGWFGEEYGKSLLPLKRQIDRKHLKKWFSSMLEDKDSTILVAEVRKQVVGYALARIEEPHQEYYTVRKAGHVWEFYVLKEHRKRGVGSALAKSVMGWFRQNSIKYVDLMVCSKDEESYSFWTSQKFRDASKTLSISM